MPTLKLTHHAVENAAPPEKGRLEYWDNLVPGLALRVTDKRAKSWILMYRLHGKQGRLTIGSYPAYSLADARDEAREALVKAHYLLHQ